VPELPPLAEALNYLKAHLVTDPRDWALGRRDAVRYALLVGWDCEERHEHDDICGGTEAMDEVAAKHAWPPEFVALIRRRRAALAGAAVPQPPNHEETT
jgi:hypothetical protein